MHHLESILEFSYAPLNLYEFDNFRNDNEIYNFLEQANIYVIAKRKLPIMRLTNANNNGFHLEIHMDNNPEILEIIMTKENNVNLFGSGLTGIKRFSNLIDFSEEYFQAFTLLGENDRFIMNANFDRIIHLASNGFISIDIKGDIRPFITYDVLYVGQCVGEHIYTRFKTHHALIEILINENIIPKNYDKVNDLLIMPFHITSDIISIINGETTEEDFVKAMTGSFSFNQKTVLLDCEKALIKAMSPKYNKTKFLQYPKSKDGLYNSELEHIVYKIGENIILKYTDDNFIFGDVTGLSPTCIEVYNDSNFIIR